MPEYGGEPYWTGGAKNTHWEYIYFDGAGYSPLPTSYFLLPSVQSAQTTHPWLALTRMKRPNTMRYQANAVKSWVLM